MDLGISGASRCEQATVELYWRYLSSESRELGDGAKTGQKVKALKAAWEARGPAAGGEECQHFLTDDGCRFGGVCNKVHRRLLVSDKKCFNCGSKAHSAEACTRPKKPPGDPKGDGKGLSLIHI